MYVLNISKKYLLKKWLIAFCFLVGGIGNVSIQKCLANKNDSVKVLALITLQQTIDLATDSSVQALTARNKHLQGQWEYHNFKVYHYPTINFQSNPLAYDRIFVKRYDSESNMDIYRLQQSLYSYGVLNIQQNIGRTGGKFFVDTELGFLRNFGESGTPYSQFTSVPFRVGYLQSIFGFNPYKWEKQIKPLAYDKVQKQLLYEIAVVAEEAANYFFELAMSQANLELSQQQVLNADTLYKIGLERYNLGLLPKSDLLALKLQTLNSKTALERAKLDRKRNYAKYCNFLRKEPIETNIQVELPTVIDSMPVSAELVLRSALANNPSILDWHEKTLSAERDLEQAKKANRFSAGISASFGFNQVANAFLAAYTHPLQQNRVSVTLSIPILDWGVGKGKILVANENRQVIQIASSQFEDELIQNVLISVEELNLHRNHIHVLEEAKQIADEAYATTLELFILGKADVSNLNLAIAGQLEAHNGYIQALKNYWSSYYKVKRLQAG